MSEFFQQYVICNIPEWLSAIGTLLAVIVALYFSRKRRKIECDFESKVSIIYNQSGSKSFKVISISIVNVGTRAFTVNSIYWQYGCFKKKLYYQRADLIEFSTILPAKINDGDEVNIYIPINIFKEFINNELKKYFLKKFIIKKYFLKIIV